MDGSHTVAGIVFASAYTNTFSLNANTLTVTGNSDFTGGTLNGGTGTIYFSGEQAQHGSWAVNLIIM